VGTHGEGLKMALRVLCDQGYAVTIHTDGERWDPYYTRNDTLHYRRKILDKAKWRHDKFVVEVYRPTSTLTLAWVSGTRSKATHEADFYYFLLHHIITRAADPPQ
jgi:hypothetical protein